MHGDQLPVLVDADLVGRDLDLQRPSPRPVRHAKEVAAHRDHALVTDATLDLQHGVEASGEQRLKACTLFGEVLGHDASGRAVYPRIRHRVQPNSQLLIQSPAGWRSAAP